MSILFILLIVWKGTTRPSRQPHAAASPPQVQPSPAAGDLPRVIVDPSTFQIPAQLDADQQRAAQEAVRLHSLALAAYWKDDLKEFERLASLALDKYREAGWIFKELGPFHDLLVNVWFQTGESSRALSEGREWLERFSDSPDHLQTVGRLEFAAGHYAEAAQYLKAFADQRPDSLVVRRQLGEFSRPWATRTTRSPPSSGAWSLSGSFMARTRRHAEADQNCSLPWRSRTDSTNTNNCGFEHCISETPP